MSPRLWGRRREPDPLGDGVWRRAHDRFRRAVDRFHAVLERLPDGGPRDGLESTGADLVAALDVVRAVCVRAQALAPSAGDDLPAGHGGVLLDVHRALSRSATLAAQAAEAVTLTVVAARQPGESASGGQGARGGRDGEAAPAGAGGTSDETLARVAAAARAADQARAQVDRAAGLLASLDRPGES